MKKHYAPIPAILNYLTDKYKDCKKVLEVGPGSTPFPLATHFVDAVDRDVSNLYKINICEEKLPFKDREFDFVYCRHVLEDISNPEFIFKELKRVSKAGYIETPSPYVELTKGVERDIYKGYCHHRGVIWNCNDGVLKIIPKYPFIDNLVCDFKDKLLDPYYWNSYFLWDDSSFISHKTFYHGVDFMVQTSYHTIFEKALKESKLNIEKFKKLTQK